MNKAWLGLVLLLAACGRESVQDNVGASERDGNDGNRARSDVEVVVPTDARWVNTGIRLSPGDLVTIEAENADGRPAAGNVIPNAEAPVPIYGVDGLLVRVGEEGFPMPTPSRRQLQGHSENTGKAIFVGRNVVPERRADDDGDQGFGSVTNAVEVVEVAYTPVTYRVRIDIEQTDAPAPLSPIDGFWFDNIGNPNPVNPVFDWDDIDNAVQFVLDISRFKDFRRILFSVNVNTTSLNTGLGIPGNNGNTAQPNLLEGVFFWRVRAQLNQSGGLVVDPQFTDRSVTFRLGVETGNQVPPVEVLTPQSGQRVNAGAVVPFEFTTGDDASGLLWRHRFFRAPCGQIPDPDGGEPARLVSPWFVFQSQLDTNAVNQPRQLFASFPSPALDEGEWLVQIETRDGADANASRTGLREIELTAGCEA